MVSAIERAANPNNLDDKDGKMDKEAAHWRL